MDPSGIVLFERGDNNSDFDEIWDDTALIEAYDRAVSLAKDINEHRKKKSLSESTSECSSTSGTLVNKNPRRWSKDTETWFPKDHCRAVYNADGIWYEAEIKSLLPQRKSCIVQFVGYGNEEEIKLNQLEPSLGEQARLAQVEVSQDTQTSPQASCHKSKGAHQKQKRSARSKAHQNTSQEYSPYQNSPKAEKKQRSSRNSSPQDLPGPSNQPFFAQASQFSFPTFAHASQIPPMMLPPPPLPLSEDVEEDDEALSSMLMAWYMSGYHTGYYQGLKCGRNRAASSSGYSPRGSRRQSPACSRKSTKSHR